MRGRGLVFLLSRCSVLFCYRQYEAQVSAQIDACQNLGRAERLRLSVDSSGHVYFDEICDAAVKEAHVATIGKRVAVEQTRIRRCSQRGGDVLQAVQYSEVVAVQSVRMQASVARLLSLLALCD